MPNQELLEISYSSPKFSLEWGGGKKFCFAAEIMHRQGGVGGKGEGGGTPKHRGQITNTINNALPIVFQHCSQLSSVPFK